MADFEQEVEWFVEQTAHLDIFAKAGAEAYARCRMFQYYSLCLLQNELAEPHSRWLHVAQAAVRGETTRRQLADVRAEIKEYRRSQIGLEVFASPSCASEDALTVLFIFALEDWPDQSRTQGNSSIVRDIDEFSSLYIEYFGRGPELLRVLKNCFGLD